MPLQTSISNIFGSARRSSLNIGNTISQVRAKNPDLANALQQIQYSYHGMESAMQNPQSEVQEFAVTKPDGSLLAWFGTRVVNGSLFSGFWTAEAYIGGSSPETAPFFSNGSIVGIGKNGQVLILDAYGNLGAWLGTQSEASQNVTGADNPGSGVIRLTVPSHGYRNGDWVNVANVGGVPNADGQWVISVLSANTFTLLGSAFAGTYTSGGTVTRFFSGGAFETMAVAAGQRITGVANNGSGLIRLTIPSHGYKTGYAVNVTNVGGVPNANGEFLVTFVDTDHVDLQGSTFAGTYTTGGISINWPTAKMIAQGDGSLLIQDATIQLTNSSGSFITIDPNLIRITVSDGSTLEALIDPTGFTVKPFGGNDPQVLIDLAAVQIYNTGGVLVAYMQNDTGASEAGQLYLQNSGGTVSVLFNPANAYPWAFTGPAHFSAVGQSPGWKPTTDSTTAFQIQNAGGTSVVNVDTSNSRVGFGGNTSPSYPVDTTGDTNTSGVFRNNGTPGETTLTITYLTGTPAAGQSSHTVTFHGGIQTAHT